MRLILPTFLRILVLGTALILPARVVISAEPSPSFSLMSSAFQNGGTIPQSYTCSGLNKSPALFWTGVPHGTRSLALIVRDPDAPGGTFVHWAIYNIDPSTKELAEGVSTSASAANAEQGVNGRGEVGYMGPCPPAGTPHHYHFRLYGLDEKLKLKAGATAEQVEAAMKGHVLGITELVGVFQR